jgi:hypothetical protein
VALDLRNPPSPLPEGMVIVEGCRQSAGGGLQPTQTYSNTATVVGIANVAGKPVTSTDADDSHYCNTPPPPTFSLGNRVWQDDSLAGFNNGQQEADEPGIANVTLALFRADQPDGAAILTTTTDANGYYLFSDLDAGAYLVEVAASNFALGGPLAGKVNSAFTEADPNLDVDQNDNGINSTEVFTKGIRSGVVTLTLNGEPTTEPDQGPGCGTTPDANCNLTVDFGFYTTNSCLSPDTGELMMPKQVITVTGVSASGVITQGPGVYSLPQGYDHLIVKRFNDPKLSEQPCGDSATSFCFKVVPGAVYTSKYANPDHPERVWACQGNYCDKFTAAYAKQHNVPLDLAPASVPAGNSVLFFLLDDDKDDRVSSLLKNGAVFEPIIQTLGLPESKLTECGSFDITEAANWQIQANDSIGIASCVVPTTLKPAFFNLFCPAHLTGEVTQ